MASPVLYHREFVILKALGGVVQLVQSSAIVVILIASESVREVDSRIERGGGRKDKLLHNSTTFIGADAPLLGLRLVNSRFGRGVCIHCHRGGANSASTALDLPIPLLVTCVKL